MRNDKNQFDEHFDVWLAGNLRQTPASTSRQFTLRVLSEIEDYKARQLLRKVMLEKKIAGWLCILTLAIFAGLLMSPSVLIFTYEFMVYCLQKLILALLQPSQINWNTIFCVVIFLVFFAKCIWDSIQSES